MGYTTDFLGHVEIDPPLNESEMCYLTAFGRSRRFDRDGDPYAVPGNPAAEQSADTPADVANRLAPGQPGLWCRWVPCWEGCCIALDGEEKIYDADRWLQYLIEHLLGPGAKAKSERHPLLRGFTFDHILNGLVVGCRRDDKEMTAILVEDNQVEEVVLHAGDPRYVDCPPLPYEDAIDRWSSYRNRRPQPRRGELLDVAAKFAPQTPG